MAAVLDHSPVAAYRTRHDAGAMPCEEEASSFARPGTRTPMGRRSLELGPQGHTAGRDAMSLCSPSHAASPRVQTLGSGVGFIDWSAAQRGPRKAHTRSPFPRSTSESAPASAPLPSPTPAPAPAQAPAPQRASSGEGPAPSQAAAEARHHRARRHSESSMEVFGTPAAAQGPFAPCVLSPRGGAGASVGSVCSSPRSLSRAGSGGWEGSASPQRSALKSAASLSAGASPQRSLKHVQFSEIVDVRVYRKKRPTRLAKCASVDCN